MSSEKPKMDIVYFCDEAAMLDEAYMGVAGLAISRRRIPSVLSDLRLLRDAHNSPRHEIKWQNTRRRGIPIRKAYIDYLASLIKRNEAHFHIRFSPMDEYEHEGVRREFETASKSFYQLLLHRTVRYYGQRCKIYVRPDNGECTRLLPTFKEALHVDGQLRYSSAADCIDSIIPLNSEREPMLQLLDVTLGALTAHRNERHVRPDVGAPKRELAEYALPALGIRSLKGNRDDGNKFSIWNVVPKKRRGPER
jgi:hypothetical protein